MITDCKVIIKHKTVIFIIFLGTFIQVFYFFENVTIIIVVHDLNALESISVKCHSIIVCHEMISHGKRKWCITVIQDMTLFIHIH